MTVVDRGGVVVVTEMAGGAGSEQEVVGVVAGYFCLYYMF